MKSVITLTAPPWCQKFKLLRNKNRDNISSGSLGSTHCQHDLFVKTTGHFSFEEFWLLVTIIERRLPCTCTFSPPGVWFWTADSGPGDGGWAPAGGVASQYLVTHARLMSIAGGEGGLPPDDCSPGTESHCDDGHWMSQLRGEIENNQL